MELLDYAVLVLSLTGISVYGIIKTRTLKEDNEEEEEQEAQVSTVRDKLVGNGMSAFSVALSVCSGFISSVSLIGFPAETYYNGAMMIWYLPMYYVAFPICAYVFLPVFYNLKMTSIYEYLERRFNLQCRLLATCLFVIQMLLYNAVALFAPALAIAHLSGINIYVSICLTAGLSALYIMLGGARAGIHTSAIQMALIFVCMILMIAIGLSKASFMDIINSAMHGKRMDLLEFRLDPRIRHSSWSLFFGGAFNIFALFATNQISMQKYMTMPTLPQAQAVVLISIICNSFILLTYILIGLMIYHFYKNCHPTLTDGNELLPHFVVDRLSHINGTIGLFAAAVYSAAISTLSSSFCSISAVIIEDIVMTYIRKTGMLFKESRIIQMTYILPGVIGVITVLLSLLCTYLKSIILEIAFIVFGAVGGPILGIFVNGIFFRRIRATAAFYGLLLSIIYSFTISIGAKVLQVRAVPLPIGTECNGTGNFTYVEPANFGYVTPFDLPIWLEIFRISYQYYSVLGVASCVIFANIIQCFCVSEGRVNEELLSSLVRKPITRIEEAEMTPMTGGTYSAKTTARESFAS